MASAGALFVSVLSVFLLLRPPLFHYDGYVCWLQALRPAQGSYINPHHLLWYPVQKAIAVATSAFGSPTPEAFQLFGIFVNSLSLALIFLLLVRLTDRLVLPLSMTIFIAFSPRIWNQGFQNLPYPLLDLLVVAFLWAAAEKDAPSRLRLAAAGMSLGIAALLHQAMALAVPAAAAGFVLAGAGPFKDRARLAAIWAGATALGVAAAYALMAWLAGVKPAGFLSWTTAYLREQHGIQLHWLQSAVKSAVGMAGAVLQTAWFHDMLSLRAKREVFWGLYGGLLVAGCAVAVVAGSRRSVRRRLGRLLRSNTGFTSAVMLALAWSVFVFFWEPAGYYWSVNLFPMAVVGTLWLRASRERTVLLVAGALVVASGWNLYANHREDQAYSVNFPPPLLEQIRRQLGPRDVFIVAGRDWFGDIDYSLLLECLDDWPRSPAMALLDDYVMPAWRDDWRRKLDLDIQAVLAARGRVFVADHVFWPDTYRDLEQTADPFSEYAHEEYAGVNGEQLRAEIQSYFDRYRLAESKFRIAEDQFWELK